MSEKREKAEQREVQKLLDIGVIREVQFSYWLANEVMVPKKNGKWRMCIDFTNLNKACPRMIIRYLEFTLWSTQPQGPK
jgi:hypothetical protein